MRVSGEQVILHVTNETFVMRLSLGSSKCEIVIDLKKANWKKLDKNGSNLSKILAPLSIFEYLESWTLSFQIVYICMYTHDTHTPKGQSQSSGSLTSLIYHPCKHCTIPVSSFQKTWQLTVHSVKTSNEEEQTAFLDCSWGCSLHPPVTKKERIQGSHLLQQ